MKAEEDQLALLCAFLVISNFMDVNKEWEEHCIQPACGLAKCHRLCSLGNKLWSWHLHTDGFALLGKTLLTEEEKQIWGEGRAELFPGAAPQDSSGSRHWNDSKDVSIEQREERPLRPPYQPVTKCGLPLGLEGNFWLKLSVLQLQGNKFCQQPWWAWKLTVLSPLR